MAVCDNRMLILRSFPLQKNGCMTRTTHIRQLLQHCNFPVLIAARPLSPPPLTMTLPPLLHTGLLSIQNVSDSCCFHLLSPLAVAVYYTAVAIADATMIVLLAIARFAAVVVAHLTIPIFLLVGCCCCRSLIFPFS